MSGKVSKIKTLYKKYESIIAYLFFGACSMVANIIAYAICAKVFNLSTVISTIIAWIVAVAIAYITNRLWVFKSKNTKHKEIIREILSFLAARILTGLLDIAIMYIFVDLLHWSDIVMKIISNIIVIVLNYIASKMFIFVKAKETSAKSKEKK